MPSASNSFGKDRRLRTKAEFQAVFDRRRRAFAGPLGVYVLCNDLGCSRLGISMSRRVGNAAKRNRIKRMLRESFRLQTWDALDIVVVPKPHDAMPLREYMLLLRQAITQAAGRKP